MVLKWVNCVPNTKIRSYGLERIQLSIQYKNQVKWSWKGVNWVHNAKLGHMVLKGVRNKMIKLGQMVLKGVNWVHNTEIRSYGLERSQLQYTIQKSCHMVLKVVNWVHSDKIESYGLEKSQLSTQCKYQVIWSWKSQLSTQYEKYRGYLLRQVAQFFISLRNPWISVFDVVLLKIELEMCFLQFLTLNLPENVFRPKSAVFIKICSFHQNLQFSSKSAVFIKICGFHQNPRFSSKSAVFIKIRISLWAFKRTSNRDSMWNERPLAYKGNPYIYFYFICPQKLRWISDGPTFFTLDLYIAAKMS